MPAESQSDCAILFCTHSDHVVVVAKLNIPINLCDLSLLEDIQLPKLLALVMSYIRFMVNNDYQSRSQFLFARYVYIQVLQKL